MIFYTADRKKSLTEGQIIELTIYDDIQPEILQEHANMLFPRGVTKHGERYFLSPNNAELSREDYIIEIVFEFVRRSYFKHRPSRQQSFFACENLNDIDSFIGKIGYKEDYKIYEVECDNFFKADMNLLKTRQSNLVMSKLAHLYWEGKSIKDFGNNSEPLWEFLLTPPIRILGEIKTK